MLVKPAPFIDAMARKLGQSIVFFNVSSRQFSRQWVDPSNPQTVAQQGVRNGFGSGSSAWSDTLNDAQRTAWNDFAATLPPRTDSLGRTYSISGKALYMQATTYAGLNADTVPTTPSGNAPAPSPVISGVAMVSTDLIVTFTNPVDMNGGYWYWRLSPALSGAARRARLTDMRTGTTDPVNSFQSGASTTFGFSAAEIRSAVTTGQYIGIQVITLSDDYRFGTSVFLPSNLI